jgi:hypothetical protein
LLQKGQTLKLLGRAVWYNMNFRITLCRAGKDPLMFTDTLPNSAAPYWEQYYKRVRKVKMEHTSHLAVMWIGAAISNTSHSTKVGFTTVKRARLKVNDHGLRQCCHNNHINISLSTYSWCIFTFRTR